MEYTAVEIEDWNKDTIEDEHLEEGENENESDESDLEIQDQPSVKIKNSEAVEALKIAIEWAKQNSLNITEIASLKNIHEKAVLANIFTKQTQSKLTSYFAIKD